MILKSLRGLVFFVLPVVALISSSTSLAQEFSAALKAQIPAVRAIALSNDVVSNTQKFYAKRNYKPLWIQGGKISPKAQHVLDTLANAHYEGLNSQDYAGAAQAVERARKDPRHLLYAEVALTAIALEYIEDIGGERLNPKSAHRNLYVKQKTVDAVGIMTRGMAADPSGSWLRRHTYNHPEYQALKRLLAQYSSGGSLTSNYPTLMDGPAMRLGDQGTRVRVLQQQLVQLGYLGAHDINGIFDEVTDQAVRDFQATKNDVTNDGVVGPYTRRALNRYDPHSRVKKIIISMERWRWMPEKPSGRYVLVNIPAFDLRAVSHGQEVLRTKVIIGQAYRKTPVFSSTIYSIRFNPSWHVPRSIAVKDKLKVLKRDPGYFPRNGYVLYDSSGRVISPHDVNWYWVDADNFDYRLRQKPGNNNALGKIRFSIRSPFNIFLHDTGEKDLFDYDVRSFSSGCIRVQNPHELAEFVFNDPARWGYNVIVDRMSGTKTENIPLKNPVRVYIGYFTVWRDEVGEMRFSDDLYGQDAAIWQALQARSRRF